MKNFFAILTFCLLVSCFSILFIGVFLQVDDSDRMFTKLFAVFFALGTLSFNAFLKLDNRKK